MLCGVKESGICKDKKMELEREKVSGEVDQRYGIRWANGSGITVNPCGPCLESFVLYF